MMGTNYEHLSAEERATIMLMRGEGCSLRAMARRLHRAPSTISRELARNSGDTSAYDARQAGARARALRRKPRPALKLAPHTVLFGVVEHYLGNLCTTPPTRSWRRVQGQYRFVGWDRNRC